MGPEEWQQQLLQPARYQVVAALVADGLLPSILVAQLQHLG